MFWIKFGLISIIVFILISVVKVLLRKVLKIEKVKREFFSYNHINKLHRIIHWILRIITMITYCFLLYMMIYQESSIYLFIVLLITFTVLEYVVRAFFEWKYTQHPKQSIITISEMLLLVTAMS
ncbi:DUF4181 domain-containing protein [Salipaludibacillus neizhouensis]|uniref:DUF4181 domain-containing protein n=1 Tax=Salipaludibacillus neizhouensis TaxID=885475 RepID=UPI000DA5EC6E|nr:DUF4181 domain-containing protein [Salipaludibacillus neizhouensis]